MRFFIFSIFLPFIHTSKYHFKSNVTDLFTIFFNRECEDWVNLFHPTNAIIKDPYSDDPSRGRVEIYNNCLEFARLILENRFRIVDYFEDSVSAVVILQVYMKSHTRCETYYNEIIQIFFDLESGLVEKLYGFFDTNRVIKEIFCAEEFEKGESSIYEVAYVEKYQNLEEKVHEFHFDEL